MSTMYPLAVVNAASITPLARTTRCHYSITVHPAPVEANEDAVTLEGKALNTTETALVTELLATATTHGA